MGVMLTLEPVAGGTPKEAIADLARVAERLGIMCCLNVNGVDVFAFPGNDPEHLYERWCLAIDNAYKTAFVLLPAEQSQ